MSQSVTGIPANEVGNVVNDFVSDGARMIIVELQADGTYTVSATF